MATRKGNDEEQFDEELHEQTDTIDHRELTVTSIRRDSTAADRTDILFSQMIADREQGRRHAEELFSQRLRHAEETFATRERDQLIAQVTIGQEEEDTAEQT